MFCVLCGPPADRSRTASADGLGRPRIVCGTGPFLRVHMRACLFLGLISCMFCVLRARRHAHELVFMPIAMFLGGWGDTDSCALTCAQTVFRGFDFMHFLCSLWTARGSPADRSAARPVSAHAHARAPFFRCDFMHSLCSLCAQTCARAGFRANRDICGHFEIVHAHARGLFFRCDFMHSLCPFDGADMRTGWFSCQSPLSLGGFSEVVVILFRAHSHAHERAFRANRHWFSEGSLRFSEVVVILIRTHSHARRLCSAIPAVSCNVLALVPIVLLPLPPVPLP